MSRNKRSTKREVKDFLNCFFENSNEINQNAASNENQQCIHEEFQDVEIKQNLHLLDSKSNSSSEEFVNVEFEEHLSLYDGSENRSDLYLGPTENLATARVVSSNVR